MLIQLQHISRWTPLALCSLLLASLLVACGGTTGGSTSTTSPTSTASSSPTTSTSGSMTMLAGNGFMLSFPPGLQLSRSGSNLVILTDSTGTIKMTIATVLDPNGAISADTLVNTAIQAQKVRLKNIQTESVPPTVMVGGASWNQQSVSGMQRLNAANVAFQSVALANVHPGNTPTSKSYTIVYSAPKSMFSQTNTTYFQPILQSFKFLT